VTAHLRDARVGDAASVARVYVDSWNDGFAGLLSSRAFTSGEVERWERDLSGPVTWRVAEDAQEVVGFAGVGPSRDPVGPRLGELDTIAVAPSSWRRGVDTLLMTDALTVLRASYDVGVLWTLADYPRGDAFYRRHGWLPDGAVRDSGRQVCYRHPLSSTG
jgi:ribosomal protein S18 acetylase RimI-like enzyme